VPPSGFRFGVGLPDDLDLRVNLRCTRLRIGPVDSSSHLHSRTGGPEIDIAGGWEVLRAAGAPAGMTTRFYPSARGAARDYPLRLTILYARLSFSGRKVEEGGGGALGEQPIAPASSVGPLRSPDLGRAVRRLWATP